MEQVLTLPVYRDDTTKTMSSVWVDMKIGMYKYLRTKSIVVKPGAVKSGHKWSMCSV
jgi:hypothetical protein